jgi:hypothetical protein
MGGKEAAAVLARQTRLNDVAPADLRELAECGLIRVVVPGQWPIYDLEGFTAVEELHRVGDKRRAWWATSMNRWEAAEALGLSLEEFDDLAACRKLQLGRFGRYRRSAIIRLRRDSC